jgi:hypothetical protein
MRIPTQTHKQIVNIWEPSRLAMNEANDCTIRALMSALDIPYLTAHSLGQEAGRVNRKGFWTRKLLKKAKANGYVKAYQETFMYDESRLRVVKENNEYSGRTYLRLRGQPYPTLRAVMPLMAKGRYIVEFRAHAFAVVDGVVYDGQRLAPLKRVISIFEVKK